MKQKILLVDDERDIIEFLKYNLEKEDFEVISAFNGEEAITKLSFDPDLIILDIMMPKMDGFEVCKKIHEMDEYKDIPIIFLTARSSEIDEVAGLELGANDFIAKPISPQKLIARVKSNLRKIQSKSYTEIDEIITLGEITIDKDRYTVFVEDEEVVFPKKEFELLFFLINNPGVVHSRETLLKNIWGTEIVVVERTIDVHIRKIREKLGKHAEMLETIKGVGYRFRDDF